MAVSKTTLFSASFDEIYSIINSNVTDPTGKTKFLYAAFPDNIATSKSTYPLVVIHPIETNDSESITVTRGTKTYSMRAVIDAYSTKNEELDHITDDIFDAIETNEATLAASNIYNFELASVDSDTVTRGEIRVHMKTLEWNFEFQKAG